MNRYCNEYNIQSKFYLLLVHTEIHSWKPPAKNLNICKGFKIIFAIRKFILFKQPQFQTIFWHNCFLGNDDTCFCLSWNKNFIILFLLIKEYLQNKKPMTPMRLVCFDIISSKKITFFCIVKWSSKKSSILVGRAPQSLSFMIKSQIFLFSWWSVLGIYGLLVYEFMLTWLLLL